MAQYNGTLSSDFTDVLLLGRTGQGKSTLARKLKNCVVSATRNQPWEEFESNHSKFVNEDPSGVTNDGESATEACVLLSNEKSRLRVLDTPGFAYGNKLDKSFWILQSILEQQEEKKLAFGRVLYFLPQRGPLERADGTLQEEIQLIQNFLGDEVFNVMVVIVTNSYKKGKPETKMDKDDIEKTKLAFSRSMENITTMKCPPIIYLPYLQKDVTAILSVTVLNDIPIRKPLIVRFEGPATEAKVKEELERNKDVKLEFHEKCQKCSTVVIYSENSKGKVPTRAIIKKERGSLMVSYKSSKCHPHFVPRYSTSEKFSSLMLHIITFAIPLTVEYYRHRRILWPTFFCKEKMICVHCEKEHLSEPCIEIDTPYGVRTDSGLVDVITSHSTTLDKLQT